MISWPKLTMPPINLYNAPKQARNMTVQTADEHTIKRNEGRIQGCVTMGGATCWALPGGHITQSREVAEKAARIVNRMITRQLAA